MKFSRLTGFATLTMGLTWTTAARADPQVAAGTGDVLTIIGDADPIVKGVMALLLMASIATWAIFIVKRRELARAQAALKKDIVILSTAPSLAAANGAALPVTAEMLQIAAGELARCSEVPSSRALTAVEERVAAQLPIAESHAVHHITWGINILASIGAISPFVGLAGTVWGIINSFLGIARSQSTSLAVVAPGIAEALIATAIGLAAAIPAVLIYNHLARSIAGFRRLLGEASVLTACLLSREIEHLDSLARDGRSLTGLSVVPLPVASTDQKAR